MRSSPTAISQWKSASAAALSIPWVASLGLLGEALGADDAESTILGFSIFFKASGRSNSIP